MWKKCVYYLQHRFHFFTTRRTSPRSAKYILNSPIPSTSCPYLLMYEIMDPIWILKIKMSDSVRGRGCSHLERQPKKVRTVGERVEQEGKKKMENLRQRKKRGIYRNKKSNTVRRKRINPASLRYSESAAILFSHYLHISSFQSIIIPIVRCAPNYTYRIESGTLLKLIFFSIPYLEII